MSGPAPAGAAGGPPPPAEAMPADLPCGLLVTDRTGLVLSINDTLCRWLGRTREDVVHRVTFQAMLTMGSRIFHQTHWAPLLQLQGSVSEVKLEMTGPGGAKLPVIVNAVQQGGPDGVRHKLALFVVKERHLYERELLAARRRAEQSLEAERDARRALHDAQAELELLRAKAEDRALFAEQMMGIVSHDLRNPLAVVDMCVHILGRGPLSPEQAEALRRLSRSNDRALRLIAELLDFTQARMGSPLSLALQPLDLHAVVADSLAELRLAHPRCRLVHLRRGDGDCEASADRLVQAIGNLVANGAQHGDRDGTITVTSSIDAGTCSVAVHNHGEPVPVALLPRLFEPMVRGAGRGASAGVGLGLFIVREIARAHGGRVGVDSAAGRGTTVTLAFPASPAVPDRPDAG